MDHVDIHTDYDGVLWGTVFLECARCGHEFRMVYANGDHEIPPCPKCRHDDAWWKAQVTIRVLQRHGKGEALRP